MHPETRYAQNGELSLAYQVYGEGPRDIVAPLPFLSHLEANWEHPTVARMLRRLGTLGRVILFNQRGVGLSDPVAAVPTLEERIDDVLAVMDAAGSERAVVFGMTDGGTVAMVTAAVHPDRVEALVLWAVFARRTRAPGYPGGRRQDDVEALLDEIPKQWGTGAIGVLSAPSLAQDEAYREFSARVERLSASPGTIVKLARASAETDVRDVLPSIRVPTLILHRVDDPLFDIDGARYVADRIPRGRLVELPGSDHAMHVDADPVLDEIEEFLTGARTGGAADRVLATVLFTDIVGSTERAAQLGDRRWRDLLEAHHTTVRRQLERFHGTEVDTAGDGFLAAFDGPAKAIRCAQATIEAVRRHDLEIRAGIHTGECEVIDGKLSGIAVHIGARVGAQAAPGEVLVSSTVKDLVVGSGIEFADHGAHRLKGVPGEWRLFSVPPGSSPAGASRPLASRT